MRSRLYKTVKPPSQLSTYSDYSMFKDGIRPMWEDEQNLHGGRWVIHVGHPPPSSYCLLDSCHVHVCMYVYVASFVQVDRMHKGRLLNLYWYEILLAVLGQQFDSANEHICGVVVNIRPKGDKVLYQCLHTMLNVENNSFRAV